MTQSSVRVSPAATNLTGYNQPRAYDPDMAPYVRGAVCKWYSSFEELYNG